MIFSKKKITTSYTIEGCPKCKKEFKRKFKKGDWVFSKTTECPACKETLQIEKIFGETIEN